MQTKRGPSLRELRNKKPIQLPKPDATAIAQRPRLAPDASRSNNRIDEFDLQWDWQARIDAGLIGGGNSGQS